MPQSVLRRLHGRRVKGEECLKTDDFILEQGNSGRLLLTTQMTEDAQTITAEAAKLALLDSQLEAVRNLAIVEYGIIGAQGACSEVAIAMCEELKQMEEAWRRCLAGTEEQREAAPLLLEFAGASETTSTRSETVAQLNAHPV